jgi:GrpB-like predicted nucleotidyltransferase (UPF0157 family)
MDEIEIVAYDPCWPERFAEEAGLIKGALDADLILGIEHFGSTAIPGLAAKPIIDILIAVRSVALARVRFVEPLERLGYAFWADNPKTDRLFFVRGMPPFGKRRTHHVHVTEPDGEGWRTLPFRDFLRAHPEAAARYERLKRDLAVRHRADREAYTEAKADFVREIMAKVASGPEAGP